MTVTPTGMTSWCLYQDPSYDPGESLAGYVGRLSRSDGRTPVVYLHGPTDTPVSTQAAPFQETFNAVAGNAYPVLVPETGATAQWATSDTVGASGFIDDAIAFAALGQGNGGFLTLPNKVGIYGVLNGALNGLVWAWNNPGKIRSIVVVAPVVDPGAFYTANPTWQASIDADWGTHGAFLAALPSISPMANLDLIRPFAHRILCVYAASDEYVDPSGVIAFAEQVGAELLEIPGNHAAVVNSAAEAAAMWTIRTIPDRASFTVRWDETDWARFKATALTLPSAPNNNVQTVRTVVRPGGRRGEVVRSIGNEGNERYIFTARGFSAPDGGVSTVWYNDDGTTTWQQGNAHRVRLSGGTYLAYMTWSNIFFSIPWIVNRAIWTGTVGGNDLVITQLENSTIPGIRLNAGGPIFASSRTAGVVTVIVDKADADRNYKGLIDIVLPGIGNYAGPVTRVDDTHLTFPLAGGDVASGGPGSWADFFSAFPYHADTRLVGDVMQGRFYPLDMDPPDYGDPDWSFVWTDAHGGPTFAGYGEFGILAAHLGIFGPPSPPEQKVQFGPTVVYES